MSYTPIALFVYNRLDHTEKTIEQLLRNNNIEKYKLFIFSDGYKSNIDKEAVLAVRKYIHSVCGFQSVTIYEQKSNCGLANSIIAGVTKIVNEYGKIIVLEDDLLCSEQFLDYMEMALEKYESKKNVFSITGYSYLKQGEKKNVEDTYFSQLTCSWSWATWKDRWAHFDENATGYTELKHDKQLCFKFDYDESYNYSAMLQMQMMNYSVLGRLMLKIKKKHMDSWAIRWYWASFINNGITLYPRDSLVENIGRDGSGTHEGKNSTDTIICDDLSSKEIEMPIYFEEDCIEKKEMREKIKNSLKN